jgi:hypothetical protein
MFYSAFKRRAARRRGDMQEEGGMADPSGANWSHSLPDSLEAPEADAWPTWTPATPPVRQPARQQLREFLRAVPREEAEAELALVHPDGSTRLVTRAALSAAIDALRPRQRQIVRLSLEERWTRQRVCAYLHGISLKTFERDQIDALDRLVAHL